MISPVLHAREEENPEKPLRKIVFLRVSGAIADFAEKPI